MYQSKSAAEAGQAATKDAALVEIERIDPVNKMLNLEYRKKIYDLATKKASPKRQNKKEPDGLFFITASYPVFHHPSAHHHQRHHLNQKHQESAWVGHYSYPGLPWFLEQHRDLR